jgi:2-phospho-L-lactate transferase/gluconeogenesis factor (CofD/UPF0052 family)
MTQPGETDGYDVETHVQALLDHGAPVDAVIVSSDTIPEAVMDRYANMGSTAVTVTQSEHPYRIIPRELLSFEKGLVRHDPQKIQAAVESIL